MDCVWALKSPTVPQFYIPLPINSSISFWRELEKAVSEKRNRNESSFVGHGQAPEKLKMNKTGLGVICSMDQG